MSDEDTGFALEENLENELDSNDEPLNLFVPEANYVVENPTIEKTLEEGSSKADKEVKGKSKEKGKGKENGKRKRKDKGKSKLKSKRNQTDTIHQFPEHHIPFDVFSAVTNRDGLVEPNLKTFYKISFFRTIQKLTKVTKIRKSDAL